MYSLFGGIAHLDALPIDANGVRAVLPLPQGRVLWLVDAVSADALDAEQRAFVEAIEAWGHVVVIGTLADLIVCAVTLLQEMELLYDPSTASPLL